MLHDGPIIVLEDDKDDEEFLMEVFSSMKVPNQIIFFKDGIAALAYLKATPEEPFLILSDVNLPKMDGLQFRSNIQNDEILKKKSIPFVFFTTAANQQAVSKAFQLNVQGFFIKPASMTELHNMVKHIVEYWKLSSHPSSLLK